MTRSKYNFIRSKQLALDEEGVSLLSDESHPLLPNPSEFLELPAPFGSEVPGSEKSQPEEQSQRRSPVAPLATASPVFDDEADDSF